MTTGAKLKSSRSKASTRLWNPARLRLSVKTMPDRIQEDNPDVDDIDRCRFIIDFVQDPDVACVQPVDACGTPRDRTLRVLLISQQGDGSARTDEDGSARTDEQVLILAADAGQVTKRRLPEDDGQADDKVSASIRSSAASSSSRLIPSRPAALSARCAASAARSSSSARSSMLISATTGLPCSLIMTGRWLCRASATSSSRCVWAAANG